MREILEILGATVLIATFQAGRTSRRMPGFDERQMRPLRYRPDRAADRKRPW